MSTNTTTPTASSWRKSVPQTYRSEEVSNISKILASLEPNATPESKLMLASRFEESCFTAASSFEDYRKRMTKRLKRMKKTYAAGATNGDASKNDAETVEKQQKEEVLQMERQFRSLYGTHLKEIVEHGPKAIHILNEYVTNPDINDCKRKASIQQGIERAISWAIELNIIPEGNVHGHKTKNIPTNPTGDTHNYFTKLKNGLERHLPTIRSYVIKYTKTELFFAEKMDDVEDALVAQSNSALVSQALSRDIETVMQQEGINLMSTAVTTSKPSSSIDTSTPADEHVDVRMTIRNIQTVLDKLRAVIPIPRRAGEEKEACEKYIDKIRMSCNVVLMYLSLPDTSSKMEVRGCLRKAHETSIEAYEYLCKHYESLADTQQRRVQSAQNQKLSSDSANSTTASSLSLPSPPSSETGNSTVVLLEDAWNKVMEYSKDVPAVNNSTTVDGAISEIDLDGHNEEQQEPSKKRQRTSMSTSAVGSITTVNTQTPRPFVIRSRVLLTPGRNPPSNLLPALKRKGAELDRSESSGCTSLRLNFGGAFEMQIFFVPLLVTIRALAPSSAPSSIEKDSTTSKNQNGDTMDDKSQKVSEEAKPQEEMSSFCRDIVHGGLSTWKSPLHLFDQYSSSSTDKLPTNTKNVAKRPTLKVRNEQISSEVNGGGKPLHILGVSGPVQTVGPLVSQQLEYASAQATRVLRRCFAEACYSKKINSEFETEISEASALLDFLALARTNYIPDWVDDDV